MLCLIAHSYFFLIEYEDEFEAAVQNVIFLKSLTEKNIWRGNFKELCFIVNSDKLAVKFAE